MSVKRARCVTDGCTAKNAPHRPYCPPCEPREDSCGVRGFAEWKGQAIGYYAAHKRVSRRNGPAREKECVTCHGPALDWAYMGGAAVELVNEKGWPYSPDPADYAAMCRSCHYAHDQRTGMAPPALLLAA